jgi:tRNA dimethylallyltransferase
MKTLPRVVFVVGPTSSGKTDLGLQIAKKYDGEVINADSRQIYREVDIGTGKPKGQHRRRGGGAVYMVEGVPHYLMDFLPPDKTYSVAEWRDAALKDIKVIAKRGKLPIVVGGTGLYISSLVDNYEFPGVSPQPELRKAYEEKTLAELVRILLASDADAASIVDLKNKRRVVRALEIISFSGKKLSALRERKAQPLVDALQIGIRRTQDDLYRRLEATIDRMVEEGLFDEVQRLLAKKISPDAPGMTSIGYRDIVRALNGEISNDDAIELFKRRTRQYTKRQITWFKRDPRIQWVASAAEGMTTVKNWIKVSPTPSTLSRFL